MQAFILAGGKGTRLKPYTVSFPKPLVPVGDCPILEIIIRQLKRHGFRKITISTGHLAGLIEAYFGKGGKWGVDIDYLRERTPLNTAGALGLIRGCEDNFLVMNGDILTTLDYGGFFREHVRQKRIATVAVTRRNSRIDFGVLETDSRGALKTYREKPVYDFLVSTGVYAFNRRVLSYIGKNEAIGMPDLLLRIKGSGHDVRCSETRAYWMDIGRVDDYEKVQDEFTADRKKFLKWK